MGKIALLDEYTINKIAAGEVVDRPASIVKELVENSIDAGATNIEVEIKKGGISYIKIVDNGHGFASDDVEMAFERHATSKIRKEEDLAKITSMGFRGEALASIAAISKVKLLTQNKDENIGTLAIVESGNILSVEEAAFNVGTQIEIKDVFFNVPARYKFLKKDYTEAGYVEDVVIRLALSNPNVSFKYINNSKTIIKTTGKGDLRSVIYDIFGKEIYQNVINFDLEQNNIKVSGMIGLPKISRSTRMHQFIFINKRYIKDKVVSSAIDKACSEKYAINKYPFIILNLDINPNRIDVNVHPAKLEVKFDNEQDIFQVVYAGIKTALEENSRRESPFTQIKTQESLENIEEKNNNIRNVELNFSNNSIIESKPKSNLLFNESVNNVENLVSKIDFSVLAPKQVKEFKFKEKTEISKENDKEIIEEKIDTVNDVNEIIYKTDEEEEKVEEIVEVQTQITEMEKIKTEQVELENNELVYKYIGQVFDTYIIIQIQEKMYIIDQHAAHERLLYEKIKLDFYSKSSNTQMLFIPILVELTQKEKNIVDENVEMFEKAGFELEEFGDKTIKISGVPNIGYDIDFSSMFRDIIDELLGATKTQKSDKEFRFLATLACKAAVKGNMKLDEQEQKELIAKMVKLDRPFTCPHGRPTAYEISKYEIERKFLRK